MAMEVKKFGAVRVSHMIGKKFLKSARQLTDTTEMIPDLEIKKSFAKFLTNSTIMIKCLTF